SRGRGAGRRGARARRRAPPGRPRRVARYGGSAVAPWPHHRAPRPGGLTSDGPGSGCVTDVIRAAVRDSRPESLLSGPVLPIGTALGARTATGVVTAGATVEHASLVADWPTGREAVVGVDVPVPDCAPQPTTTTTTGVTTTTVAGTTGATTTTDAPVAPQGGP